MMRLKQLIPILCLLFVTSFVNGQEVPKHNIYFGNDNAELSATVQQLLDTIYYNLPEGRQVLIGIIGEMDKSKSPLINNQLGEARMKTAYDYLMAKGVKEKDMTRLVKDKNNQNIGANSDKTKEVFNYELHLKKAPPKAKIVYWYKRLNQEYPKKPNCFIVNPNNVSNLTSYEGTIISIPRYCFVYETGELAENDINICFLEFYKKSDILLADMNTMNKGKALQTGGILNISATCNNRTVVLSPPNSITIKFPAKKYVSGMKLYDGFERGGTISWQESEIQNTAANQLVYAFKILKTGWYNCGTTVEGQNTGTLTVAVDSAYRQEVRLVLKDMNSVISGTYIDGRTVQFNNLPIGQKAYIVSYCYRNDVPAYCAKEITISANGKETLDLQETTYKDLQTYLGTLQ